MSKKKLFILLILSLVATLISYQFIKKALIGRGKSSMEVTYSADVAPILNQHCVSCHHDGGSGPFALTSYDEVMRKKKTIRKVISQNIMPPWPADPTYTHFVDENVLTDEEKQTIYKWMTGGHLFGDSSELPALPSFNDLSSLGKPDVTLYMDSIFIEGNNRDKFFSVKIPFELPKDTFLRTIEFVTGEHNIVHHLNGHLINYDADKKNDVLAGKRVLNVEVHPEQFLEDFAEMQLFHDNGQLGQNNRIESAVNYLPGVRGTRYPESIGGFPVNRKAAIYIKSLHYGPVQHDAWDRSHFNLFFSKTPPTRPTSELMLGTNGLSAIQPQLIIPPDTVMTFRTSYRLTYDISLLTVNPHLHLLGKNFLAYGLTLEGDTIPLIRINRWDFRWQYFYTYRHPVKLPKGTLIVAEATFDNTSNNLNNPYDPPRTIKERFEFEGGSMRTTDEMFQFILTYIPYESGDETIDMTAN